MVRTAVAEAVDRVQEAFLCAATLLTALLMRELIVVLVVVM
jgi:hypothetical protein